jgi:hypothetical protein
MGLLASSSVLSISRAVCVESEKMDGFKMMMNRRFLADANELCRLDVGELTAGFSSGKFTPLEVAQATLARAEQVQERFNAELSLRYAVPAIYQYNEFANAGGLMSYSGSIKESYRWAGIYTGRILKGDKPADLPVQQSTKVELIINLKTAKALGIAVPLLTFTAVPDYHLLKRAPPSRSHQ